MGYGSYSYSSRTTRAASAGYYTRSVDDIFVQQRKGTIHKSMSPQGLVVREARDSDEHPLTVPIILGLDLTGSMRMIPHNLIKDGLPTLMSGLIQGGCPDATLCFIGIGDHEADDYPLQVGQFESGDEELDMWLTRTYLEGGGGANPGESYSLAHYFGAYKTAIDSYEKRQTKGFIITIGDEPNLPSIPLYAVNEIIGEGEQYQTMSDEELLKAAQEKYHVFHINIDHRNTERAKAYWKNLLGQNFINTDKYEDVPSIIIKTVLDNMNQDTLIADTPNVGGEFPEDGEFDDATTGGYTENPQSDGDILL